MQRCARAVLLTPEGFVLLIRIRGRRDELWITPGGRIEFGESSRAALARELREELGCSTAKIGPEIWVRRGRLLADQGWIEEQEHFFLVPTERFDPAPDGMETSELEILLGFRWWSIAEIEGSGERFVPGRLAGLLRDLLRHGTPADVVDASD